MTQYPPLLPQLYHFLAYSIKKPMPMHLEKGMFIVSIDVDAGSRKLGLINKGKNDANVHKYFSEYRVGEVEESTVPMLVETFDRVEIPVTFAVRGQLTEVNGSVLEMLLDSTVKHDIGAHGYYHTEFTGLSSVEAEKELAMISTGLKKYGIVPRSFVFPRNKVAHLDLLARHGYKCYRGYGNFLKDCMYIEKTGKLYNIHPSLYLEKGARLTYLKGILDACVAKKLPFHAWFHPWSFGETKECVQKIINKVFIPFFSYAQVKRKSNLLDFETMYSAALKVENMKNDTAS